jgi:N-acyl-phosphatidylethanolamine-hydrolysing phospholipase D
MFSAIAAVLLACAMMPDAEPSPEHLAQSGIRAAPRVNHRFESNDGPLPQGAIVKWRWHALIDGLPRPPENGYAFPVDRPDVAWIKANRRRGLIPCILRATLATPGISRR